MIKIFYFQLKTTPKNIKTAITFAVLVQIDARNQILVYNAYLLIYFAAKTICKTLYTTDKI